MFQFAAFASLDLCIQSRMTHSGRVSPFGHLWINAYLPAPHNFSQAIASFIACNRQGIHHMHLFAWPYNECVFRHSPYRLSFRVVPYSKSSFDHLNTSWYNHNPYNFHAPSLTRFRCTTTSSKLLKNKYCMTLLSFKNIHVKSLLGFTSDVKAFDWHRCAI